MRRTIEGLILAATLWAVTAGGALAGTYDVYGCRLPDGKPIPANGWAPHTVWDGTAVNDSCHAGGGLTGSLRPDIAVMVSAQAGWVFEAPPNTTIEEYDLFRSSVVTPPYGRGIWLYHDAAIWEGISPSRYAQTACVAIGSCSGQGDARYPLAHANLYQQAALRILRLFLVAQCNGSAPCPPATSYVTIWASRFRLSDTQSPTFTREPSGALITSAAAVDGERALTFAAADRGGGIASAGFVIDGQNIEDLPAQSPATSCQRPYVFVVPCPLTLERTMTLDTTRISNGKHSIQVALTDAAGNRTLSSPVEIEVRNRGVPNGAGATQFARLETWLTTRGSARRTSGVVSYGRTRSITGRLATPEGAPIVGAALDVSSTTGRPGSRARVIGQVVTDGNGAFTYTPKAGSSRRIGVSYRAYTLDAAASAVSEVVLQTRAGVRLTVSPKRVGPHGVIRFRGRLLGGPGRAGTQVVIYALGGARSRIPVATVRADSRGRFRYRYRFTNSSPGTPYRFRASMHAQRSYPYATGSSPPVTVRIR